MERRKYTIYKNGIDGGALSTAAEAPKEAAGGAERGSERRRGGSTNSVTVCNE